MITTVNQVSSAWFNNKLVRKSLHNDDIMILTRDLREPVVIL